VTSWWRAPAAQFFCTHGGSGDVAFVGDSVVAWLAVALSCCSNIAMVVLAGGVLWWVLSRRRLRRAAGGRARRSEAGVRHVVLLAGVADAALRSRRVGAPLARFLQDDWQR
jgi:hypothetical protein